MNRQPHSLDITCSYQLGKSKTKKKLGVSKFEGWIHLKGGKTEIVLPMRSFVKNFLDKLHDIFAGENTGDITNITSVSAGAGASSDRYGIVLGTGINNVALTQTALTSQKEEADDNITHKTTTFIAPYSPGPSQIYSGVRRLFSNADAQQWYLYEVGLYSKKVASTASMGQGVIMLTRDRVDELFAALSDKLIELQFVIGRDEDNGGAVVNLMRLFYNLYLKGNANDSAFLPRYGTVSITHPSASLSSPLVLDGAASKLWGIVVGMIPEGSDPVSMDENNIEDIWTNLSYGANSITAVTISGNKASFTVSRDITNGTTSSVRINRIGLLTKGAVVDPSTLQNDQILLMVNKPTNPFPINLVPNQTIRVEYTFEIQV